MCLVTLTLNCLYCTLNPKNCVKMLFVSIDNSSERQPDHIVSEDQHSVYVRRFIADFVQERMLGLPSFVLTKTIVQWLSLIGLDVSKNIKENGSALEELCKKVDLHFIRRYGFSAT